MVDYITSRDGTTIAWWRSGAGHPLLLVHGTTADHARWSAILPRLEQDFTVYTMDRRGRGESGDSPAYHVLREAEDVAAVVEAIGQPVYVLGHSYGAICSLEASLLTDRISRLILYEPPIPTEFPLYPPGVPDRMQSLIDTGNNQAALELFFREVVKMPDRELDIYSHLPAWTGRIRLAPTIPRELMIDQMYRFQAEKFSGLGIPTLLLLGGDSPPEFRQPLELLSSALPNAELVILPGQRHVAMDTHPELFLEQVLQFLRS